MAQRDYDDLKALDDADHSELERARQALTILGFDENSTSDTIPLRSPISGVVLDVGTATGELQRSLDNANAIATIADINSVWVVGDLYPRDLGSVKTGQPVDVAVTGYPGADPSRRHRQHLRLPSIQPRSRSRSASCCPIPATN